MKATYHSHSLWWCIATGVCFLLEKKQVLFPYVFKERLWQMGTWQFLYWYIPATISSEVSFSALDSIEWVPIHTASHLNLHLTMSIISAFINVGAKPQSEKLSTSNFLTEFKFNYYGLGAAISFHWFQTYLHSPFQQSTGDIQRQLNSWRKSIWSDGSRFWFTYNLIGSLFVRYGCLLLHIYFMMTSVHSSLIE